MILVLLKETNWKCAMAVALLLANDKNEYDYYSVREELSESYLRNCLANGQDYTEVFFLDVKVTPSMECLLEARGFCGKNIKSVSFDSISMGGKGEREAIDAIAERMGIKSRDEKVRKLWKTYTSPDRCSDTTAYSSMLESASDIYANTGDATFFYHLVEYLGSGVSSEEAEKAEEKNLTFENILDCYGSSLIEEATRHLPFASEECGGIENARTIAADILDKLQNHEDNSWGKELKRYSHALLPTAYQDRNFRFTEDWSPISYEYSRCRLMGFSYGMEQLRRKLDRVQGTPSVFIIGASGTGKENVARQLHFRSHGSFAKFHAFNCANVNEEIIKDELFGHVKGAYTGANSDRDGLFRQANGGTVFLDEIQDMPMSIQGLLLRVLNDGEFKRQGADRTERTSVRIIVATNKDIKELGRMVCEGRFRADLYFRVTQVIFRIPPLYERLEDIKVIAESYWSSHNCDEGGKFLPCLDEHDIAALMEYDYPGNVRELQEILQRAIAMRKKDFDIFIREQKELTELFPRPGRQMDLPSALSKTDFNVSELPVTLTMNDVIYKYAAYVFDAYDHNVTRAAESMKIASNTLKRYLQKAKSIKNMDK